MIKSFSTLFHRSSLFAAIPAALVFSSCGDDDSASPEQGKVSFVNVASHVAPTNLKFLVDNNEKASVDYGKASAYQTIQTGSRPLQVTAGTQVALNQQLTVEKDKNYSFFATFSSSSSAVGALLVPDDLTAPASGKARIRVVHLGQNISTPIRLSQVASTISGPVVTDVITNVPANTASAFVDVTPSNYGLSILDNNNSTLAQVGDGSGSGTGTKNYEAGKLYTVIVSGTAGSLNQEQRLKAFVAQNN